MEDWSTREIDQKHAIGNYEFTLTPRALFAPNGTALPFTDKSKLIHLLEKLTSEEPHQQKLQAEDSMMSDSTDATAEMSECNIPDRKIALVDGMVLVQKLTKKPAIVVTVNDLSHYFNDRLMSLTRDYDEIILVFDSYKADSLNRMTRERRRHGKDPIQYHIKDNTNIKHIPMSRFLSHDKQKSDPTEYLAEKTLEYNTDSPKLIIVSASGSTKSNSVLSFEDNNHEEADTLLIHQAVLATHRNSPDSEMMFFSPDTDCLSRNTSISMESGVIELRSVWTALGAGCAKALPTFHAFTGADNTGRFARIGKATWLQLFLRMGGNVTNALRMLSDASEVTEDMLSALATFVSAAYSPKGIQIESIPELRWYIFCRHMAESDKLPPTLGALKQHILRACIQARVWGQASIAQQELLDPPQHGFYRDNDGLVKTITSHVLPAPEAIIELV